MNTNSMRILLLLSLAFGFLLGQKTIAEKVAQGR
jgi:hypothetical protein